MNAFDPGTVELIGKSVGDGEEGRFKALVIHNEGEQFLGRRQYRPRPVRRQHRRLGRDRGADRAGPEGHARRCKDAPFPVVGAPSGMALGGGCEVLLHCDAVQAHAESYIGLVEVGVGLIPGWGGCTTLLRRWAENPRAPKGPMPPVGQGLRDDLDRAGGEVGLRGEGDAAAPRRPTASPSTATGCWRTPRRARSRWSRATPRPSRAAAPARRLRPRRAGHGGAAAGRPRPRHAA